MRELRTQGVGGNSGVLAHSWNPEASSSDKGACHQAQRPELVTQDPTHRGSIQLLQIVFRPLNTATPLPIKGHRSL